MPNTHRHLVMSVLESLVSAVQKEEEKINDLNVFPVPDGDTGSNMLATLISAWENISDASITDVEVLNDFSRGALLGARGNSGVITSQIIKGFTEGVKKVGKLSWSTSDLRIILRSSKEFAYKSVGSPVEGTILSVIKAIDEKYERNAKTIKSAFEQVLEIAKKATEYTPEQLPVLKEAGVVDSGAYGLTLMIEGALKALKGKPLKLGKIKASSDEGIFQKADATKNIGYCTEFIMTLKKPEIFNEKLFKKKLIEDLSGDSLVMIKEDDILKVHVHVKKPGEVFNAAQKFGEFSKIKSENMATQAEHAGHLVEGDKFKTSKKTNDKELAIISVSNGKGLDKLFIKLGASHLILGGQSMNPSVEDFVKLIKDIEHKNIVILPNNSNIILAVQTAKKVIEDKNIFIVPTKTLPQGIVALYNINKEMYDFHEYEEEVKEVIKKVSEGEITIAVRDAKMNGINVRKGEFISLKDKKILSSTKTIEESAKILIDKIIEDGSEIISIIRNDDVTEKQINLLVKYIKSKNEDLEIEIIFGGQEVYHLLIFGEE
ncbi:MAG: DAK2 domain-containing protein [Mycoplasmataceae bacterium]|nr:DAK2 domain-containing protein [Mycoplasmataceae bacterium]